VDLLPPDANPEVSANRVILPTSACKREEMRHSLINSRILLEQAESDVWEEMMLPEHDPFFDYIHLVIQFACVACFSAVLPLTPLIVLINHLTSMRLNAYKICRGRRRPMAHKTGGIGVWEHVLHVVTVIAVFTNCSLMALTSSQFHIVRETWGNLGLFGVIVGWEYIMLMIVISYQIKNQMLSHIEGAQISWGKMMKTKTLIRYHRINIQ